MWILRIESWCHTSSFYKQVREFEFLRTRTCSAQLNLSLLFCNNRRDTSCSSRNSVVKIHKNDSTPMTYTSHVFRMTSSESPNGISVSTFLSLFFAMPMPSLFSTSTYNAIWNIYLYLFIYILLWIVLSFLGV